MSALPIVNKPHRSIVYGRLDQFPVEADVVLCILDTQQAMLVAEAMGNMNWLRIQRMRLTPLQHFLNTTFRVDTPL